MAGLAATTPADVPMLTFRVGALSCALSLADVREVTAMVALTPLPGAREHLLGVIDYHGTPCPVVDIRARLGLDDAPLTLEQHLLVLGLEGEIFAIPCDQAEQVVWGLVRPVAADGSSGALIKGFVQKTDGVILLLDSAHLRRNPAGEPAAVHVTAPNGNGAHTEVSI
ncbi:MAG TPA: chemotaxis protein CheW [Candidatus Dormibacteraeota bacterium]|nr:chemotaxis protein CheW [Candidatus Dormibacteraeota bacterium]